MKPLKHSWIRYIQVYTKCEQTIENKQHDLIKFQTYLNKIKKNEGLYEKNEVTQICKL